MTNGILLALLERDSHLRQAFDDADLGVAVVASDGGVRAVNPAFLEHLGYGEDELVGRSLLEITHPEDVELGGDLLRRAFAGEIPRYRLEKRYLRKDGTSLWARVRVEVVEDAGDERLVVGTIEALDQARLLRLLHRASRATDDAATVEDAVEATMRALCDHVGWPIGVAELRSPHGPGLRTRAVVGTGHERCGQMLRRHRVEAATPGRRADRVLATRRVGHEVGREPACGETSHCSGAWVGIPIVGGDEVFGILELFSSYVEGISNETLTAFEDIGVHLGHGIERLRLVERAAEAAGARAAFAAKAAHELRTPMASAGLAVSTLATRGDRLDEQQRDVLLATADRSMTQLRELVARLVDLATPTISGRAHVEPVQLQAAVAGALADLPDGTGRNVTNAVAGDVVALSDAVVLRQILGNLFGNALRYGGPTVVAHSERRNGRLSLVIEDDGAGVPDDFVDRLFEPFARASDDRRGYGLGLTISRDLARSFGGDLVHRAVQPHGAAFAISFPEPS